MGTEVQLITDRMLTFSPRLCSVMKWVTRIYYGSPVADILTAIGLAQEVRTFNFVPFNGGWHFHYGWPGSDRTWFQFVTVHRQLTFSLRLAWLREYVISISCSSSAADITIGLAQRVRNFNFVWFIDGWYSRYDWPGSGSTWFQFVTVHRRLIFSLRLAWLRLYVIPFVAVHLRLTFSLHWPGSVCRWFQFLTVHWLTCSLRLAWLRMYVFSISYSSSAADIHCSDCKRCSNCLFNAESLTTAIFYDIQRSWVTAVSHCIPWRVPIFLLHFHCLGGTPISHDRRIWD